MNPRRENGGGVCFAHPDSNIMTAQSKAIRFASPPLGARAAPALDNPNLGQLILLDNKEKYNMTLGQYVDGQPYPINS